MDRIKCLPKDTAVECKIYGDAEVEENSLRRGHGSVEGREASYKMIFPPMGMFRNDKR